MSIERFSMENKTDSNSGLPNSKGPEKHTSKYVVARLLAIGSMALSSCGIKVPSGNQEIDSSESIPPKVNVENIPASISEGSIPAIIPTEEGQTVDIISSSYPTNPDNFIIDTRTNEEKMALIRSWAPDDVDKEIILYNAELRRMGVDPKDIVFKASIVDGKSWALYPQNIKTETSYIVSIDKMTRRSIDLFGYLNRDPSDDFFNLESVNFDNAQAVGDISGWHVFAEVKDGKVIQWLDAEYDRINTVEVEPTPTPEPSYIVNAKLPEIGSMEAAETYDTWSKEFSNVTFKEDILSGKLLEELTSYVAENPVFTDEAECSEIVDKYAIDMAGTKYFHVFIHSNRTYAENPNKRPIKIISYFPFYDKELFAELGIDPVENARGMKSGGFRKWPIWTVAWAYHNPSGKTTLGLSLTSIFSHIGTVVDILKNEREQDFRPLPFYKIENVKRSDEEAKKNNDLIMYFLWKQYPELKPDEGLIKEWIKNMEMPEELQNDLFLLDWYPFGW